MLLVFFLLQFAVLVLLCVGLIVQLRFNRAAAFKGDDAAARKIILPAFEPLLIVLGGFNFLCALFMAIVMVTKVYDKSVPNLVLKVLYSVEQFDVTLVMVFMLQKSVSMPALKRAVVIATVLSSYSVSYMWLVLTYSDSSKQILFVKWLHVVHSLVLVLAIHMVIWPPTRASKRTLRELTLYDIVRHILTLITLMLVMNPATLDKGIYPFYVMLAWVALNPLVIWHVLKVDTGYWRGMGQRACTLQTRFKQKHQMHEKVSSEGLHVLIEMRRKYIIDFAHLDLRQQISVGMTSTVFQGILRSRFRVAVKVYQPCNFNEDVVAGFFHEAALCGLLHHPNIVRFFGMLGKLPLPQETNDTDDFGSHTGTAQLHLFSLA